MSDTTALAYFKDKLQGLVAAEGDCAASRDEARKAFCDSMHIITAAAATTAAVTEKVMGTFLYAGKVKSAYFVIDGTTLAPDATSYATVNLYKIGTDGTTTTSLATWTTSTTAFTDSVPKVGTLASALTCAVGESFAYSIEKSSATTNAAVPAGHIDFEYERTA